MVLKQWLQYRLCFLVVATQGTDMSFVDKLNMKFDRDPNYVKSKQTDGTFTIAHYAGRVTYTAFEWLDKNRDTMPPGAMQMLQTAENRLLSLIFKGKNSVCVSSS